MLRWVAPRGNAYIDGSGPANARGSEIGLPPSDVAASTIDLNPAFSYLKLTECPVGLLINFNVTLLKNGIRRVVRPDLYVKSPVSPVSPV